MESWFVLVLAILAALVVSACNEDEIGSLPEAQGPGYATWVGIQGNVPEAQVTSGGWSLCHQSDFADSTSVIATILANCSGNQLMLACRDIGNPNLVLMAHAPRAAVTTDTGNANNGLSTVSNGVAWYFNADWSWGFFVPGDGVIKSNCDVETGSFPNLRMCVHAGAGNLNSGYRCGTTTLNGNGTWERLIYTNA